MLSREEKKIVWITGGTKGLGLEMVKVFGKSGNVVLTNYAGDDKRAEEVRRMAQMESMDIQVFQADVRRPEELKSIVDYAADHYGRLDILINNAGCGMTGSTEATAPADFQRLVNINLTGKYNCIYVALPLLQRSNRANIINVASASGVNPSAGMSAYCSGAAGIIMMTRCLAQDLAKWNIRVNCVSPSMLDGGMSQRCFLEQDREWVKKNNPQRRLGVFGDVINCIHWLCSVEAQYINGENIMITGGK